ncbi:hypothetical protein AB1P65_09435 [Roseibium alexandrii]
MNRRGFLGAMGGAAIGTPAALKSAIAKGSAGVVPNAGIGLETSCVGNGPGSWRANDVLRLLSPSRRPAKSNYHENKFEDVECLVSVSRSHKSRMTSELERQLALEHAVADFIREQKLDWAGLTEETVIRLAKKVAGE